MSENANSTSTWSSIVSGVSSYISSSKKKKDAANAAAASIKTAPTNIAYQNALSTLTNQQNYVLNQQLANAKSDTERMQLITEALAKINEASVQNNANASYKTAMVILASVSLFAVGTYFFTREK